MPSTAAFELFGGGSGSVNEIDFTYPDGEVHGPHLKDLVSAACRVGPCTGRLPTVAAGTATRASATARRCGATCATA